MLYAKQNGARSPSVEPCENHRRRDDRDIPPPEARRQVFRQRPQAVLPWRNHQDQKGEQRDIKAESDTGNSGEQSACPGMEADARQRVGDAAGDKPEFESRAPVGDAHRAGKPGRPTAEQVQQGDVLDKIENPGENLHLCDDRAESACQLRFPAGVLYRQVALPATLFSSGRTASGCLSGHTRRRRFSQTAPTALPGWSGVPGGAGAASPPPTATGGLAGRRSRK